MTPRPDDDLVRAIQEHVPWFVSGARRNDIPTRIAGLVPGDLRGGSKRPASFIDRIRDQRQGEICWGEDFANGIHLANRGQGKHPSPIGIWKNAQAQERARAHAPFPNRGVSGSDVVHGLIAWGIRPEDDRDDAVTDLDREEDWEDRADEVPVPESCIRLVLGADETAIRAALDAGCPCPYAHDVDQRYMDLRGDTLYTATTGPVLGGHAECIVDYDDEGPWVLGSWGADFGRGGLAHVSWGYMRSEAVHVVYAVLPDGLPVLQ